MQSIIKMILLCVFFCAFIACIVGLHFSKLAAKKNIKHKNSNIKIEKINNLHQQISSGIEMTKK